MEEKNLVKDSHFEEYGEVRVDSKYRITLGRTAPHPASSYRVYRNSLGQFILDPQATVPAYEAWLFRNPKAKRAVQEGLEDARKKRLVKADEDYSKYLDD